MRKNLFLLFFVALGLQGFCQEVIEEAYVQFEVTDVTSSNPQAQAMLDMMKGSTMDLYFKSGKQRMDMDMMGGMMKMSTFMNIDKEGAGNAMFMDMMGRKIKVDMNDEELEQFQSQNQQADQEAKIETDHSDTKEIAGFKCHKVVCKFENQNDIVMTAYVTKDIKSPESVIQNAGDYDLGGFPLEYTVTNPEFNLTYSAQKFERSVSDDAFSQPEGYEAMTFEQFVQSMGAMSGAMGQ